jgi:hypothetical protein
MVIGGGERVYNSYKSGQGWTAMAEGGLAITELPMMGRKALSATFGREAGRPPPVYCCVVQW